jgi:hypothetical protein
LIPWSAASVLLGTAAIAWGGGVVGWFAGLICVAVGVGLVAVLFVLRVETDTDGVTVSDFRGRHRFAAGASDVRLRETPLLIGSARTMDIDMHGARVAIPLSVFPKDVAKTLEAAVRKALASTSGD